jgi:uncharacterized protein YuzE
MITYFYDKEADVFYFSDGAPRASDETVEVGNDVLLRIAPRTKRVRGFTILNASRRSQSATLPVPMPLSFTAITV